MYVVYTLSSVSSDNNITANIQRFFELRAIELKHNDIRSVKEKYATIAIAFIYSLLFGMHNMILHNLYSGCCSVWLESHRQSAIEGQCMCENSNSSRCMDTQHISLLFSRRYNVSEWNVLASLMCGRETATLMVLISQRANTTNEMLISSLSYSLFFPFSRYSNNLFISVYAFAHTLSFRPVLYCPTNKAVISKPIQINCDNNSPPDIKTVQLNVSKLTDKLNRLTQ